MIAGSKLRLMITSRSPIELKQMTFNQETKMIKSFELRIVFLALLFVFALSILANENVDAQGKQTAKGAPICPDPSIPCKTTATFEPYDLQFQIPANAVIWETGHFYAVILKSVTSPNDNCDAFVPEADRLAAQALFPRSKVFASRCAFPGSIFYTNVAPNTQFMAVYAGSSKQAAEQMLIKVKATGKFPGANIRRMKAGFNGT